MIRYPAKWNYQKQGLWSTSAVWTKPTATLKLRTRSFLHPWKRSRISYCSTLPGCGFTKPEVPRLRLHAISCLAWKSLSQQIASCRVNPPKNWGSTSWCWDTKPKCMPKPCCLHTGWGRERRGSPDTGDPGFRLPLPVPRDTRTAPTTLTTGKVAGHHNSLPPSLSRGFHSRCAAPALWEAPTLFCLCGGLLQKHGSMAFLTC